MSEEQQRGNAANGQDGDQAEGEGGGEARAESEAGGRQGDGGAAPDRLTALEAEKNEARERMLRIAAEFENYKKRVRREQADAETKSRESVLRDMLEIVDNLERAAGVSEGVDPKALKQGVDLVVRLFQNKLERYDVKSFEAKGQPFDPRLHDAISQVPTADAPPGSVVNEVQKGYKIGDRLLRPAMVAVAVGLPSSSAGAGAGAGGAKGEGGGGDSGQKA